MLFTKIGYARVPVPKTLVINQFTVYSSMASHLPGRKVAIVTVQNNRWFKLWVACRNYGAHIFILGIFYQDSTMVHNIRKNAVIY